MPKPNELLLSLGVYSYLHVILRQKQSKV